MSRSNTGEKNEISKKSVKKIFEILLVEENLTVQQIADFFDAAPWRIRQLIRKNLIELPPRRGRKYPAKRRKIIQLLEQGEHSYSEIARMVGVSHPAVIHHARKMAGHNFHKRQKPKRCPVHGIVNVWPCVACEAEKLRASKTFTQ